MSTPILRRIRPAAENAMAMVVLAFIGLREMHGRREVSLPRIVLSLDLGQPCRDAGLDIAQLLLQLRLLRLSPRKEAFVELQPMLNASSLLYEKNRVLRQISDDGLP